MTLTLQTSWSSAHFYKNPKWSDRENRERFGQCFSDFGHGHDYKLEVSFHVSDQNKDQKNDWQLNKDADNLVDELHKIIFELHETLDHQHLNFVLPTFKEQIPTTENLALYCHLEIQKKLSQQQLKVTLSLIRLFEIPELWIELRSTEIQADPYST